MDEIIREIVLLNAYLAISLVSVTFAIYALCLGYLRKEKFEFEHDKEKRLEKTKEKITELTKKREGLDGNKLIELNKELRKTTNELKNIESQYKPLTAEGAVRTPIIYLFTSLIFSILSLLGFETVSIDFFLILFIISMGVMVLAIIKIYNTIKRVEKAALRVEHSAGFNVSYLNNEKNKTIKLGKKERIDIVVGSKLDVDNFTLCVFIPNKIEVQSHNFKEFFKTLPSDYGYGDQALCRTSSLLFRKCDHTAFTLNVLSNELGKYELMLELSGKSVKTLNTSLTLEVIE